MLSVAKSSFQSYVSFKTGRKLSQPDGVRGTVRRHQTQQQQVNPVKNTMNKYKRYLFGVDYTALSMSMVTDDIS